MENENAWHIFYAPKVELGNKNSENLWLAIIEQIQGLNWYIQEDKRKESRRMTVWDKEGQAFWQNV